MGKLALHIRPYQKQDATEVAALHNLLYPEAWHTPLSLNNWVSTVRECGGELWVSGWGNSVVAYAAVAPVPGLPGVVHLSGGVLASYRSRGIGQQMLDHVLALAHQNKIQQISCTLHSLNDATARFLFRRGFVLEHEEWVMKRPYLTQLPPSIPPNPDCHIHSCARHEAIPLFCTLYDASFRPHPWYQPYTEEEVAATLESNRDLLFLYHQQTPIGFAWVHEQDARQGSIEPLGVVPGHQGKGYGRYLLLTALHHLRQKGVTQAIIGAWKQNQAAIHLYQQLGFQLTQSIYYLIYNLTNKSDQKENQI